MPSKSAPKKTVAETKVVEKVVAPTKATKETKAAAPKETKVKETKAKKETVPVVETPQQVVEVQNVVVNTDTSIGDGFSEFISKFQSMLAQFSSLKTELKNLERKTVKQLKVVENLNNKKKRKGTRAPSGFVKPSPISEELATFLGKDKGVEMARTDVTREINKYIRANNLQDKENGRKINPDKALCELLKITKDSDVVLTYFNLQRYMGPHFPKSVKAVAAEAAAAAVA
jgi:chromatin remodeling complex protein RSC6